MPRGDHFSTPIGTRIGACRESSRGPTGHLIATRRRRHNRYWRIPCCAGRGNIQFLPQSFDRTKPVAICAVWSQWLTFVNMMLNVGFPLVDMVQE